MNKQDAINRFVDCCKDPLNNVRREFAVKSQFNRRAWELDDLNGRIRIDASPLPVIKVWNTVGYALKNALDGTGTYEFSLLASEYLDLKRQFWGNYEPDKNYLKNMGATDSDHVERFYYNIQFVDTVTGITSNKAVHRFTGPYTNVAEHIEKRKKVITTMVETGKVRVFEGDKSVEISILDNANARANNKLVVGSRETFDIINTLLWFELERIFDDYNKTK